WDKRAVLRELIHNEGDELKNAIIFCNRKRDISELLRSLIRHNFSVGALHGDMDQYSRMSTLADFKDNKITLLVASDVAARGLDIPAVSHVFNYDVPTHAEDYIHRIGRTGRANRSGKAFTIVTKSDQKYISAIEEMSNEKIEWFNRDLSTLTTTDQKDDIILKRKSPTPSKKTAQKERSVHTQKSLKDDKVGYMKATNNKVNLLQKCHSRKNKNHTPSGFGDDIPAFML
ncbi:helicase-related protein, partial [Bartonella sp. AA83SXKL]|uniref:helicase-related protein n=1 Tax=Bartonella sp. AA83SXKL TaxID=3243439 RepID=UPI0035CED629